MKLQNLILIPLICTALTFILTACGNESAEDEQARIEAEAAEQARIEAAEKARLEAEAAAKLRRAAEKAGLILGNDKQTVIGVTNEDMEECVVPDGVTGIGDQAFSSCEKLTVVTLPNSVKSIGIRAFSDCEKLKNITIPNSVTSIGDWAFANCHSLAEITIPGSVTSIGGGAFAGGPQIVIAPENQNFIFDQNRILIDKTQKVLVCAPESLSGSYTIPAGITGIGKSAFYHCSKLTEITIPSHVTSIGDGAFAGVAQVKVSPNHPVFTLDPSGALIDKKQKRLLYLQSPTDEDYTIPGSITSIGNMALYNCDNLTTVTIPTSVTSIGGGAFSDCDNLTDITIPDSVTTIGTFAFSGCPSLMSITIPGRFTDANVEKWDLPSSCEIIRKEIEPHNP